MNFDKVGEHTDNLDKVRHPAGTVISIGNSALGLWHTFKAKASILLPLVTIIALKESDGERL